MKITVVELRQFRKLGFVKHLHPPPVDIDDILVAQLFDDPVGVHWRYAQRLANLLLRERHLERA
jgi:hypothetical protein